VLVAEQHGIYCPGNIKSIGRIIDNDKTIQTDDHEEQPLVNETTKDDAEEKDHRVCISSRPRMIYSALSDFARICCWQNMMRSKLVFRK